MTEVELFRNLRRFARRQGENYFTECLAGVLNLDASLARAFVTELAGKTVCGTRVSTASIRVETQVRVEGAIPDMRVWLNQKPAIGVEVKLAAARGSDQLAKYLARYREIPRLAYIAGYEDKISDDDYGHKRYLAPRRGRRHFVWWDFYDLIRGAGTRAERRTPLRLALLTLFADSGFEPVHGAIGNLQSTDPSERAERREEFRKLWFPTQTWLRRTGWRFYQDQVDPWVSEPSRPRRVEKMWFDPVHQHGLLRLRLYSEAQAESDSVFRALERLRAPWRKFLILTQEGPERNSGYYSWSVTAALSLQRLFGRTTDPRSLASRLYGFTKSVVETAN